ncbi:TPA: hypothetical protein EYN98_07710 [Candidatus Poribacteria bacterium]|nr:hypothetical protein [Candidatus Poribacteria bacterium]HIB92083.1 hypothetical protein [Candidatus Poribacteria bacterium]HIN30034.1 hypothetical protein [Candidatus Poribacteria bacterium]HIO06970.1 hypothetical protein [Candidatus Poribacteria bacterium]
MRFTYFWQLWQVILALAVVVGITSFVYIRLKSPVSSRVRAILICLRILAATILLTCLLEPVLVQQIDITPPNNLLILADRSESMEIQDVLHNGKKIDRMFPVNHLLFSRDSDFVQQLSNRFATHIYQFDQDLKQVPHKTPEIQTGIGLTDITGSIQTAINEWRGQTIAGVVLITDGGHNVSKFEVDQFVGLKVPIYPIGVGDPVPPNDLGITKIEVSPVNYTDHNAEIKVTIRSIGYMGKKIRLMLKQDDRVIGTETTTLSNQENQTVTFTITPREEGVLQYLVSLPTLENEVTTDNNQKTFTLKVVRSKLRVLYTDGQPRWDYAFLKRVLERDPNIEATCLVLSLKKRNTRIQPEFPKNEAELLAYDVLIIGDIKANELTSNQQQIIKSFVEEHGKSIVFLGGKNSLGRNGLGRSEIADLLPIVSPPIGCRFRDQDFSLRLTTQGKFHPIMQLGETSKLNDAIWRDLPPLPRRIGGFQLRSGATTLAEFHQSKSPEPIIVFQPHGLGKSLLIAAEGLWNWGFGVWDFKDEDDSYSRFWGQAIRWLASQPSTKQIHIIADKNTYLIGEKIKVTIYTYDKNYQPFDNARLKVDVALPDKKVFRIRTNQDDSVSGRYIAEFLVDQEGKYTLTVSGTFGGASIGEDKVTVFAEQQVAEFENPQLNQGLLTSLAEQTGGMYLPIAEARSLPGQIKNSRESIFVTEEKDLWDSPIILILAAGLLGTEWFLRKWKGLV